MLRMFFRLEFLIAPQERQKHILGNVLGIVGAFCPPQGDAPYHIYVLIDKAGIIVSLDHIQSPSIISDLLEKLFTYNIHQKAF